MERCSYIFCRSQAGTGWWPHLGADLFSGRHRSRNLWTGSSLLVTVDFPQRCSFPCPFVILAGNTGQYPATAPRTTGDCKLPFANEARGSPGTHHSHTCPASPSACPTGPYRYATPLHHLALAQSTASVLTAARTMSLTVRTDTENPVLPSPKQPRAPRICRP